MEEELKTTSTGTLPPNIPPYYEEEMNTLYFEDGSRRIDFVLAFEEGEIDNQENRQTFQDNICKKGLQIELEDRSFSQDGKTYFLKIHAPFHVLKRHADVLNIKRPKPIKIDDDSEETSGSVFSESVIPTDSTTLWRKFSNIVSYNRDLIPDSLENWFCKTKKILEIQAQDPQTEMIHYTDAQRSRIAWEILIRTPYHNDGRASTGILYLLSDKSYAAAYSLHDGPYGKGEFKPGFEEPCERRLLYSEWARPASWYKIQPLGLIRRYFGPKTALYFAWLRFYTIILMPAAVAGIFTMFYGVVTVNNNVPSLEICDTNIIGSVAMCPMCDKKCHYWHLNEVCFHSKAVYLCDNAATVVFSIFMSLWATMFMELWKRKQATLALEWNLADLDFGTEQIRPEFASSVKNYKLNPVTMKMEPYLPLKDKVYRILCVNSAVLFVLCLLLAAVFGIIAYRIILVAVLYGSNNRVWHSYAKMATSITSSILNLGVIMIMGKIYRKLTEKLTDMEQPRTQREYEYSFTLKMFLFEFINMYSSLIYIAFFKGRFFGHPGETFTLLGYRQDQCEMGGCLFEVCVQLAITMIGKQILNNISELYWIEAINWWKRRWRTKDGPKNRKAKTRWEKDYNLRECDGMVLFDEYLEMVIQYGFITLFVVAFPLAPFFALLNNIVEIRLDAYKFLTQQRRPLMQRVPNIGAWQAILRGISIFAVITNAFMIAYTSDFIPRLIYVFGYSNRRSLAGYINSSLSYFNVSDFTETNAPENPALDAQNVTICRYQDYRHPPTDPNKYDLTMEYWYIFAARLSFVVVFEHLVFLITELLSYTIPDIPKSVQQRIQRKRFLAREALFKSQIEKPDKPTTLDIVKSKEDTSKIQLPNT